MHINMVLVSQTLTTFHFLQIADRFTCNNGKLVKVLTNLRKIVFLD